MFETGGREEQKKTKSGPNERKNCKGKREQKKSRSLDLDKMDFVGLYGRQLKK